MIDDDPPVVCELCGEVCLRSFTVACEKCGRLMCDMCENDVCECDGDDEDDDWEASNDGK